MKPSAPERPARAGTLHNAIWRWHFYAGLFCTPFVIWLALTGTIYLWRPQIEAWLDRTYDRLPISGPMTSPDAQVQAALRAVPGSTLHQYVLPERSDAAVRILVKKDGQDQRVYVGPRSLRVLNVVTEERRPMRVVFHLHGELLAGPVGSYLVEVAACWTIVMLLTGLYLWWPRGRTGLAGILYPRLSLSGRTRWRDLHATGGLWVCLCALGLISTGLPWAEGWGRYLSEARQLTGTSDGVVDWTVGGKLPKADGMLGAHAGHGEMQMPTPPFPAGELARVIATVRPLGLTAPVLISPPVRVGAPWSVASDAADRPLRSNLAVDGSSGRVMSRVDFRQRHWIDRTIGYGVAAHEGALFGLANQLVGTATALMLIILTVSGAILWWRRRPVGLLGAPPATGRPRSRGGLVATIIALAIYLPLFGLTLLLVLLFETSVRRWRPETARWLGLRSKSPALRT